MKLLLYGSLLISITCLIGIFVIKTGNKEIKKYLVFGSAGFYFLFAASAYYIHLESKVELSEPDKAELKVSKPKVEASVEVTESPKPEVAASKIDVKVRVTPGKLQKPNQKVTMQFLITNKSEADVSDLRMKFARGEFSDHFYLEEIKGNDKVYIFDNIITLGDLKAGEDKKVQFDLTPKNNVSYSGEIIWQVGNNYIVDEHTKPLASLIHLPLDEEFEHGEDSDFVSFEDLKPVDDFENTNEDETVTVTPAGAEGEGAGETSTEDNAWEEPITSETITESAYE